MVRNLRPMDDQDRARQFGVEGRWTGADLSATVVRSDAYVDLLTKTSTESAKYFMGHGARDRDDPNAGYMFADLVADGTGTSTDGTSLTGGTWRFIVYDDSEDEVPIVGPTYDYDTMDQASAARTERAVLPLLVPGAGKDKKIAAQFKAISSEDGASVDSDSSLSIPYTQALM